jgi:hypothetical protein
VASTFIFSIANYITEMAQSGQPPLISQENLLEIYSEIVSEYVIENPNPKEKKGKKGVQSVLGNDAIKRSLLVESKKIISYLEKKGDWEESKGQREGGSEKEGESESERESIRIFTGFTFNSTQYIQAR